MGEPIIEVERLDKQYRLGVVGSTTLREDLARWRRRLSGGKPERPTQEFWALRDVSFSVQQGEVVGVIGRNGAGKSTLLKILSRITEPTRGRAILRGRVASLLEVGTGFHADLTGRENVFLNGAILGMRRAEIAAHFDEIVAFAEVEKFIDTPVKHYSSGMYVRLAFAVAAHLEPEILIVDEVLAVGDSSFQQKCLGKMRAAARESRTVLFVSHHMPSIQALCSRGIVFSKGRLVHDGPARSAIAAYSSTGPELLAPEDVGAPGRMPSDGTLRLTAVAVTDDQGRALQTALCGQDCTIVLRFTSRAALANVGFLVAINDEVGTRIAQLNSCIRGRPLSLKEGETIVQCRIPRLPFSPRRYHLAVKVLRHDSCLLFVPNAGHLVVENADFFGSGRMPDPEWSGFVQVPHDWSQSS